MTIGPRQMPEDRQRLLRNIHCNSQETKESIDVFKRFVQHSPLIYVDPETTHFIYDAGKSLPPETTLSIEDFPTETGLIALDWGEPGYVYLGWIGHRDMNALRIYTSMRGGSPTLPVLHMDTIADVEFMQNNMNLLEPSIRESGSEVIHTLKALALLIQQDVVLESRTVSVTDKKQKAKLKKQRVSASQMRTRVISIRRHDSGASRKGTSNREYIHRWVVKGHWRNQWYPSRKMHRPVWVAPHMKGPDDAPLLAGEKVYTLRKAENDQL